MLLLRFLTNAVFVLVAGMVLTGGTVLKLSRGKLEMAQVSAWALLLLVLVLSLAASARAWREPIRLGWVGRAWTWLSERVSPRAAAGLLIANAVLLFLAHVLKHWGLGTDGFDVSYVHQAFFYPWQDGRWLRADVLPSGTALEGHLTFSFLLFAPLTTLLRSDELLFLLQSVLLFAPIWLFLRAGPLAERSRVWFWFVLLVIAHRALRSSAVFDFREDAIAYAAFFGMALCLLRGRVAAYFIFLAIACLSKENIFAVTLCFVGPILLSRALPLSARTRRWTALATAVFSLAYGAVAFKVLIPAFTAGHAEAHPFFARYGAYGSSVPEILLAVATSPGAWFQLAQHAFTPAALKYLLLLFGPFLPLYVLGRGRETWVWLLPALPGLAMNLGHGYARQRAMTFHYELILLPFLVIAAAFAARDWLEKTRGNERAPAWFWVCLIALCFSDRWPMFHLRAHWPEPAHFAIHQALKRLPVPAEPVLVGMRLSAQINHWPALRYIDTPPEACDPERGARLAREFPARFKDSAQALWLLDLRSGCDPAIRDALRALGCSEVALPEGAPLPIALVRLDCIQG